MSCIDWVRRAFAALLLTLSAVQAQGQVPTDAAPPSVPELVQTAFQRGDFAELERLYGLYGKPGVRSALTGIPRVGHFWMGIGRVNDANLRVTDEYYGQLDALTGKWAQEHPKSVLAQLLFAQSLSAHAVAARGTGYAQTVSPSAWADFRKYLELSLAQLRRSEALAASDSSWNLLMLDVGRDLSWDKERLWDIFRSGLAKDPENDDLYLKLETALLPKWGGDMVAVERLIALAVTNTQERRGLEMYAILYAALSEQQVKQTLFTNTRASWISMKAGFDALIKRYPHVDHRNKFAYFACMANDKATLREQLDLIGDKFVPQFWGSNAQRTFEGCKKLAQQV